MTIRNKKLRRGNSLVEFALIAPLLVAVMLGVTQFAFYAYAFISVQNAARVAALRNSFGEESAANQKAACEFATDELSGIIRMSGSTITAGCLTAPLIVSSQLCDNTTPCADTTASADGGPAVSVEVRFTMPQWLPLRGGDVITRSSQMRVRNLQ